MLSFSNRRKIERYPNSSIIHAPSNHYTAYTFYPMSDYGRPYFMHLLDADDQHDTKGD